jgi:hypothetical protein
MFSVELLVKVFKMLTFLKTYMPYLMLMGWREYVLDIY